jgi:hypothetical protein
MSNDLIIYIICGVVLAGSLSSVFLFENKTKTPQNGGKKTRHRKYKKGKNTRRK